MHRPELHDEIASAGRQREPAEPAGRAAPSQEVDESIAITGAPVANGLALRPSLLGDLGLGRPPLASRSPGQRLG
jgi:hypothetical protein